MYNLAFKDDDILVEDTTEQIYYFVYIDIIVLMVIIMNKFIVENLFRIFLFCSLFQTKPYQVKFNPVEKVQITLSFIQKAIHFLCYNYHLSEFLIQLQFRFLPLIMLISLGRRRTLMMRKFLLHPFFFFFFNPTTDR